MMKLQTKLVICTKRVKGATFFHTASEVLLSLIGGKDVSFKDIEDLLDYGVDGIKSPKAKEQIIGGLLNWRDDNNLPLFNETKDIDLKKITQYNSKYNLDENGGILFDRFNPTGILPEGETSSIDFSALIREYIGAIQDQIKYVDPNFESTSTDIKYKPQLERSFGVTFDSKVITGTLDVLFPLLKLLIDTKAQDIFGKQKIKKLPTRCLP